MIRTFFSTSTTICEARTLNTRLVRKSQEKRQHKINGELSTA